MPSQQAVGDTKLSKSGQNRLERKAGWTTGQAGEQGGQEHIRFEKCQSEDLHLG